MSIGRFLSNFFTTIRNFNTMDFDPIKHCNTYKNDGCVHVDGPLCRADCPDVMPEMVIETNSDVYINPVGLHIHSEKDVITLKQGASIVRMDRSMLDKIYSAVLCNDSK